MATIVNNPPAQPVQATEGDNSMALVVGVVVLALILFVLFFSNAFGFLRRGVLPSAAPNSNPSIQVPDQIDVNVNTPNQ
jgi:hypothetical protein